MSTYMRHRRHVKSKLLQICTKAERVLDDMCVVVCVCFQWPCLSVIYIQSLLAAGAVWLNLGPPRQPEGCRGGPRCSQTAPATRRDCVYHHGTDTRLEQVKLEIIELEKKAF